MMKPPRWDYTLLFLLPFLLALLSVALLGSHSRMMADDYCTASVGINTDAWSGMRYWYENWTGNYTNFFLKSALAPYQPALHPHTTGALLVLGWLAVLTLVYQVCSVLSIAHRLVCSLILTTVGWCVLIITAPDFQSVYWFGSQVYTLSVIVICFHAALVVYILRQPQLALSRLIGLSVVSFVFGFINTGISEMVPIFSILMTSLAFLAALVLLRGDARRNALILLGATLLGVGIGFLVTLAAPGNVIRQAAVLEAKDYQSGEAAPEKLIVLAFAFAVQVMITPATGLISALVFLVSAVLAYRYIPDEQAERWRKWQPIFNLSVLVAFGIALVVVAAPLYAVAHPSPRSLLVLRLWQIMVVAFWGYLAGVGMKRRGRWQARILQWSQSRLIVGGIVALLLLIPLVAVARNGLLLPEFSTYSAAWDARHNQIVQAHTAGEKVVQVALEPNYLERFLRIDDFSEWYACASSFYGIELQVNELPDAG